MLLQNIPAELRSLNQWVVATGDKLPKNPKTGQSASVTDPRTWGSFLDAVNSGYPHVGFVLTGSDPYAIIDLDNKPEKPASPVQIELHHRILESIPAYTERSISGSGFHIIVKGKIPHGVKRDNVEIYSSQRYFILTGNVVRHAPIIEAQDVLNNMFGQMEPQAVADLREEEDTDTDQAIVDMAANAVNGSKFTSLCNGRWQELGYPSQSEADYALLSMFAFYTKSNEQCRRLFRMSALGRREKATKNNKYLDYALAKIRAKAPELVNFEALKMQAVVVAETKLPVKPLRDITAAPGLIGDIAQYIYESSVRPVRDIALAAALAFTSGIIGRSYNISGTGLNQYLILLAKTGAGKEGAIAGINRIAAALRPQLPMIDQFIGPSAFASGQAMIKVLDERPCFVSVLGEFGMTLSQICSPSAPAPLVMMRKVMLDLYTKSGATDLLRSSVYSDTEKNTKIIQAPCVTILGESTPETLYNTIGSEHIAEGLIPRFSIIRYDGPRVARNPMAGAPPSQGLIAKLLEMVTVALTTTNNNTVVQVRLDRESEHALSDFDIEADSKINAAKSDTDMQLWNRAHLKALKLSGLLAAATNPHEPVVTIEEAKWAIDFVRTETESTADTFRDGYTGVGDHRMVNDLRRIIDDFYACDAQMLIAYGVGERMAVDKVLPITYLMRRCYPLKGFRESKLGASASLKYTIQALVDAGELIEVPPIQVQQRYAMRTKAWISAKRMQECPSMLAPKGNEGNMISLNFSRR